MIPLQNVCLTHTYKCHVLMVEQEWPADATPIPHSLPDASGSQSCQCDTTHLEVLCRHHANLIDVIDSHESFAKLLHQPYFQRRS